MTPLQIAELHAQFCQAEWATWAERALEAEARVMALRACEEAERKGMLRAAREHFGAQVVEAGR